ncbi:uncharacterized protein LOC128675515 isoform X2 [Plodia interpunctella]|uniref:uncharacterized protein LOC128675515 isoform X2 n=1 Tax=Plodia interpunctella TaxID=58824 RepID=UPI002367955F|nr:uncharacterized protein LOC128675515 isoform X2 [Plodia interpunctella]
MPTNFLKCLVIVLVILVLLDSCCGGKIVKTKKRKVNKKSDLIRRINTGGNLFRNDTSVEQGRGFASSILSLGRVFNFFPVGGERECKPATDTIARAGICLNPYDCRQRDGRASGDCAHGLGVCCVFEVTCGGKIENNLTYFMSPGFPEAWSGDRDCGITVHKTHAGIMQLRIDFIQFTIGQPNRTTGECDEDAMILGEGASNFTICGQNYGQHLYYTLSSGSEKREAGELADTKTTRLTIRTRGSEMPRLWLMRMAQMPLANSAPHDCLQYHTENNGTIKTFNYAYNGRHLSGHEYRACVRRNTGFCSVRYTPCDSRSFRIGGGNGGLTGGSAFYYGTAGSNGPSAGFNGTNSSSIGDVTMAPSEPDVDNEAQPSEPSVTGGQMGQPAQPAQPPGIVDDSPMIDEGMMPADGPGIQDDEMEGSGADPNVAPSITPAPQASPGILAMTGRSRSDVAHLEENLKSLAESWSRNNRRIRPERSQEGKEEDEDRWEESDRKFDRNSKWSQKKKNKNAIKSNNDQGKTWKWNRWSPYAQHYSKEDDRLRYNGYGKYGSGLGGRYGRQRCRDRITIPCENEYFVSSSSFVPGVCDPHHCGDSFCPGVAFDQCRVETSISPFAVSVHFAHPTPKRSPEENIGACLRYSQLPCDS